MDLESELRKLLGRRAASNEPVEVEVAASADLEFDVQVVEEKEDVVLETASDWSPLPWHREQWHERDLEIEIEWPSNQAA